jgi:superfamily II DNA or RNA helicase
MDQQLLTFDAEKPHSRAGFTLRDYQVRDLDETFRLWDSGIRGTLTRAATGSGKTICSIAKMDQWLNRGENYRAMVVSYEQQLVWQFAEEIEDFLGVKPSIEMGNERIHHLHIPQITVATRQSLLVATPPSDDELAALKDFGIFDAGCAPHRMTKRWLQLLKAGTAEPQEVREAIEEVNCQPEAKDGRWGRVYKFDWKYNWLILWDEAHKHAAHLATVGPVVEWFDKNPDSRRCGMTGTPKRSDGVSIGTVMFPGVSLDYPLNKPGHPCAVRDGWAVPYIQRYIKVEGVDFANLKRIGKDFDEVELERQLGDEKILASLVEPLLDMVEDRQTLIFSPGVQMAKDVARYINARSRMICTCGKTRWYPTLLIGDGAQCDCGRMMEVGDINKHPDQAYEVDGETPHSERRRIYTSHQGGEFQFLCVCGLAKEGYNDPNIACVTVFRPVSEAASSLAEQMKGRSCRPLRGLVNATMTKEERLTAIANSSKPSALIIDLVGITGLADCASTVEIYAEGLPDEILDRAKVILAAKGIDEPADVQGAIDQAQREDSAAREAARLEREASEQKARELAERRAKADARVDYSVHEQGVSANIDPNSMTDSQRKKLAFMGMSLLNVHVTKRQAGRMISQLVQGERIEEVARTNRLSQDQWAVQSPSRAQQWRLRELGATWVLTPRQASLVISASRSPYEFMATMTAAISGAQSHSQLTAAGADLRDVGRTVHLSPETTNFLTDLGRRRRAALGPMTDTF